MASEGGERFDRSLKMEVLKELASDFAVIGAAPGALAHHFEFAEEEPPDIEREHGFTCFSLKKSAGENCSTN